MEMSLVMRMRDVITDDLYEACRGDRSFLYSLLERLVGSHTEQYLIDYCEAMYEGFPEEDFPEELHAIIEELKNESE